MKNKIQRHHLIFARKNYLTGDNRRLREHPNNIVKIDSEAHSELHNHMFDVFGDDLIDCKFSTELILAINEANKVRERNALRQVGRMCLLAYKHKDEFALDFLIEQVEFLE